MPPQIKHARGSPDDQYIYINDHDELRHWAEKLQVTPDALKIAVGKVGNCGTKVREHLKTPI